MATTIAAPTTTDRTMLSAFVVVSTTLLPDGVA
jgi:hypothetical protein